MTAPSSNPDQVTVLVIDDTPEIRLLLTKWIERLEGFHLVADAGDGQSGVEAARIHKPGIVLLDLAMPVMDGLEALPLIRDASPASRVIVLSGFERSAMGTVAIQRGAAAYVQKGTPLTEIGEVLADVAGRPRSAARLVSAVASDVADRERSRAPGSEAEDELGRIYSALSVAAHEIHGPLSIIATILDMFRPVAESTPGDDRAELVEVMHAQCRLIEQVTRDLVVATKHRSNDLSLAVASLDVLPTLRVAAAAFNAQAEVLVTCPLDLIAAVDEIRLHQMLGNLLSNAVKYGEPPIRLVALAVPGQVEFRVVDCGPGVPDEFRPLLFQPFARAAGRSNSGTGLGLSVVRALAEAHGGRAWYEDVPGGSAFCFSVPNR